MHIHVPHIRYMYMWTMNAILRVGSRSCLERLHDRDV